MSGDIPIGSPPAPPGRHAAPSGWYPDPLDASLERYWDGWQWSRTTRPSESKAASAAPRTYQPPPPHQPHQPNASQQPNSLQPQPYQPQPFQQQPHQQYQQQYQQLPATTAPGRKATFTADGVRLAGWWWRALAILIDGLIVGVVTALAASPILAAVFARFGDYFNRAMSAQQQGLPIPPQPPVTDFITPSENFAFLAIAVAIETAYIVGFLRWKSATPGKLAVGLRVVPVDHGRDPGPLAWSSILARAIVWVLGGTTGLFWILRLIDILFPLWQPRRQALHDLAARTQVVKIR